MVNHFTICPTLKHMPALGEAAIRLHRLVSVAVWPIAIHSWFDHHDSMGHFTVRAQPSSVGARARRGDALLAAGSGDQRVHAQDPTGPL
jgi:hypothetical protein